MFRYCNKPHIFALATTCDDNAGDGKDGGDAGRIAGDAAYAGDVAAVQAVNTILFRRFHPPEPQPR